MLFNLGNKKYTCVDIGSYAIKVAIIQNKNNQLHLLDADYTHLPPDTIQDGKIIDHTIVGNKLKSLFSNLKHKPKNIITTVSSGNIITRNIELPLMEGDELEEAIRWELDDVLPFSSEETIFDYLVTDTDEEKMNLLIIAVKEEIINNFMLPFEKIDLKPRVINAQSMALLSLLEYQSNLDKASAVIDIGHEGTRVVLGGRNHIELSRNIETAGFDFTASIMELQNLDYREAEKHKISNGISIEKESDGLDPTETSFLNFGNDMLNTAREIAGEISRSLEFYSIKNRGESIDQVYLTGGSIFLEGLIEVIDEEIDPTPVLLNPLKDFENSSIISKDESHLYTIALGLVASEVLYNEG